MDGSQVGVLEQADQVGLSSLLECQDGEGLETQVGLEVLGNLTDQALEGQLAEEQLGGLLVLANPTQGQGGNDGASLRLQWQGRPWRAASWASGGLAGGLLGTGHCG
jgi:hypothetical protein